jgi:hypothetical protein
MRAPRALAAALALVPALLAAPTATATTNQVSPSADIAIPMAFPAVNGSYKPIAGNFDCDEGTDNPPGADYDEEPAIVWYAAGSAPDYLWTDLAITSGVLTKTQATLSVNGTYVPIVGDFGSDRCDDILWYGEGPAPDVLWWGGPTGFTNGVPISVPGFYRPVGLFQRIVWYAPFGTESMWEGTGNRSAPFAVRAFPHAWNGLAQILWYTPGTGPDSIWAITSDPGQPISYIVEPVSISGTYVTARHQSSVVLHGPGPAIDQFMSTAFSEFITFTRVSIAGTYVMGGKGRVLVWHGPGTAPDQVWLTAPWAG